MLDLLNLKNILILLIGSWCYIYKLLLYDIDDKPYNSVKTFTKYKLMENSQIVLDVNLVLNRKIIFFNFYKWLGTRFKFGSSSNKPTVIYAIICWWNCFSRHFSKRLTLYARHIFSVNLFRIFVPLENFSLIWRRHHCRWKAANFDLCSALMAFEQWGFFYLPHGPSVCNGHFRGPVTLTPNAERSAVELSLSFIMT